MDLHSILITTHLIGVALGVGGATFGGILYLKAMKDGKVDPMEGGMALSYFYSSANRTCYVSSLRLWIFS